MIRHILKDGTEVQDITGHTVKGVPEVYRILAEISQGGGKKDAESDGQIRS